jgi:DNA-binding CsgD family transcriptional regulator
MTGISGVAKQQQRRLTKPQQAELVERYQSGDLMTELAKKFEIDRRTVSAILKRHKVPTRPQGLSVEQIQDAVLMYAQGNSLAVIGSKLGVDTRTVDHRLQGQGVQMRDTRGRK